MNKQEFERAQNQGQMIINALTGTEEEGTVCEIDYYKLADYIMSADSEGGFSSFTIRGKFSDFTIEGEGFVGSVNGSFFCEFRDEGEGYPLVVERVDVSYMTCETWSTDEDLCDENGNYKELANDFTTKSFEEFIERNY